MAIRNKMSSKYELDMSIKFWEKNQNKLSEKFPQQKERPEDLQKNWYPKF